MSAIARTVTSTFTNQMAVAATIHCLAGCAIGEVAGLVIGTVFGLGNFIVTVLSIALAFIIGYTLSTFPLLKAGLTPLAAFTIVLAADSLSITAMEITDNLVMNMIPGAMNAGLVNPVFWIAMPISMVVAFMAAVPVNSLLLKKGKGHALVHEYHHAQHEGHN